MSLSFCSGCMGLLYAGLSVFVTGFLFSGYIFGGVFSFIVIGFRPEGRGTFLCAAKEKYPKETRARRLAR